MSAAALLHDIGYCFAENPYHHPMIGGDFLRKRGYHTTAKIIETHTYAPEATLFIGYKTRFSTDYFPKYWEQVLIDYASMHAGKPGELITPLDKLTRLKNKRDDMFYNLIEHAQGRLIKEVDEVNSLKNGNSETLNAYEFIG